MTARAELIRALGAVVDSPAGAAAAGPALGLGPAPGAAAHTEVFAIQTHPHAAVHLGPEGMLGGEAADRIAGFWRTLGLAPPPDADHLAALLGLYARLGDEAVVASGNRRAAITKAADMLLWEHIASWAPVYLDAVAGLDDPFHRAWAELAGEVLAAETGRLPAGLGLPAALAAAPPAAELDASAGALLDGVLAPVRSGIVLTRSDLARAGRRLGVGLRHGERRYTLAAMLEQDAAGVVGWLADTARDWAARHRRRATGTAAPIAAWWAQRAAATGAALELLASRPAPTSAR